MDANGLPSPLERLLGPLASGLSPEMARYIATFQADADTQRRVSELGEKANVGDLNSLERAEYKSYIKVSTFIAILQNKARKRLDSNREPDS